MTFGNIGVVRFRLTDSYDVDVITSKVSAIPDGYSFTNLYAGLNLARTDVLSEARGSRLDVPRIMIVVTDGKFSEGFGGERGAEGS